MDSNVAGDAQLHTQESIVIGGGCFWCLEAVYVLIDGVAHVVSGYAGDSADTAQYETVTTGSTDHAEVVQVAFDATIITLDDILDIFWTIHNPTTPDRQGNDIGPQYRSVIFYATPTQCAIAKASIQKAQTFWDEPIVTQLLPLDRFYPAEDYHQNYYQNHPEEGYCQAVINPKLGKLREKFTARLKQPEITASSEDS